MCSGNFLISCFIYSICDKSCARPVVRQTSDTLFGVYRHCGFQHVNHKSLGPHQTDVSQWHVGMEAFQMLLRSPQSCSFYVLFKNKSSLMRKNKHMWMPFSSRLQPDLKRKNLSSQGGAGPFGPISLNMKAKQWNQTQQAWRVNRAAWVKNKNEHRYMKQWRIQ